MLKILATEKSCLECKMSFFVNHVILIAKHYLYSCRCKNTYPLVNVFTARLKKDQDLELLIAKSKNNLSNHTAKWGKFLRNTKRNTDLWFTYLKYCALDTSHTYQGEHNWVCRVFWCCVCVLEWMCFWMCEIEIII